MRKEDRFALEVNTFFRDKYTILTNEVGPFSNIIGIFFHELMVYYTNYFISLDFLHSFRPVLL